ncbi:NADH:flavin oxidoreductase/NADH oxidase [Gottschalkia acidurici 9a]|uniref:NADH:flavin oxidoreductase/NADH oxidase n=1 Tax=Gottschalkia acidurici (strain ATCC 7906 / DSM 604 / BCRC 14475 / CIP 104303 / KCTC 5404 / NCIMB 10678 / 9a) TaxID=1128398 RepID=K0B444_GOTA9|nr:NADH:flavin oxidoreductase [Gottschalkia acidurici]AFS79331.1 NADH:flavin oxidoreductase/NADH oxidase [Gottschalkia acidurici 9a]
MTNIMDPIKIKNILFKNRVVMAPMVCFGWPSENGMMSEKLIDHYKKRASTGIGLMISQSISVSSKESCDGGIGIYNEDHINYLSNIRETCHQNGTRFFSQLIYPGLAYHYSSSLDINKMSKDDLRKIRDEFIHSAQLCKKAGLDGIELHGAHGFFLNMITSPISNNREDEYGGDINRRLLLVKEIVEGIKRFTDDDFIVSYRMGWNDCLDTDIKMAQALEKIGIELLHISSGIPMDRELEMPEDFHFNNIVYTGSQVKKHVNIPTIVVNDIRTFARGKYLVNHDMCNFVAYGKPFLADESFMTKSLENDKYESCFRCKKCQWFINSDNCPAKRKNQIDNI